MANFLVSNINGRKHRVIYKALVENHSEVPFFDLEPQQNGWELMSNIKVGDIVYSISVDKKVKFAYEVTRIMDGVLLSENCENVISDDGGAMRVLFGKIHENKRNGIPYNVFISDKAIEDSKINPDTKMLRISFNIASF